MTAERNLGSPNSSSNYPAYEAASLSGIARWKIQELLYLRVNPKGDWLEKSCCWCTEPRIVSSQSASRWRSLGWETFWRNSWPVDQFIIHIGVEFICKQPTLSLRVNKLRERSGLLWASCQISENHWMSKTRIYNIRRLSPQKCKWSC